MNHILQKLRESRLREAESHEYKFNIPWREVIQDEYETVATVYNPRQMDYASDIMERAEEDFNDADMASYARDDGLVFIKSMTMSFDDRLRCIITVETTKVLGDEDMHRLIEYLEGQMSDGWGEGFEQKEIAEFQEDSEEWIEDPDDEDNGGYYDTVEHHYYVSGNFWWSGEKSHPYEITQVEETQNESSEALSVDDMRRELVKYGDFTEEEAANLHGLELTSAWSKLPKDLKEDATADYRKEVEDILNHQLGSYETGVKVLGIKVKSETPGTVTLDVEYDVNIQIPMVDSEDGRTYYEQEVEYRRRTMTIDAPELNESVSKTTIKEFPTDSEAYEWAEENGYKVDKIQNGHGEKACICWMRKIEESIDTSTGSEFKNAGYTWKVLDSKGDYVLVHAEDKKWHPYVVAWKLSDDGSWAQGHYFEKEDEARKYLAHKTR